MAFCLSVRYSPLANYLSPAANVLPTVDKEIEEPSLPVISSSTTPLGVREDNISSPQIDTGKSFLTRAGLDTSLITHIFFGVRLVFTTAWFKGHLGEFLVNRVMRQRLPKDEYSLFKDITLPIKDGTAQIDHVILSPFGVFVIETKYMKGWIFGSGTQKKWTQTLYRYKNRFQNPLIQNSNHIKALRELTNIPESTIHSVVVFAGSATLKTRLPTCVVYLGGLVGYIQSKKVRLLGPSEITQITTAISTNRLRRGLTTDVQHAKHLREKYRPVADTIRLNSNSNQTTQSESPACPKCGGKMFKRVAKKGKHTGNEFWGCASFPVCRGTNSKQ